MCSRLLEAGCNSQSLNSSHWRRIPRIPAVRSTQMKRLVPARKRNEVIVAAAGGLVRKMRLLAVLEETAGAWTDENHPDLTTPEDVGIWLRDTRARWRRSPPEWEDAVGWLPPGFVHPPQRLTPRVMVTFNPQVLTALTGCGCRRIAARAGRLRTICPGTRNKTCPAFV